MNDSISNLESLRRAMRREWWKACRWEGIPDEEISSAKFVSFSPDNPYMKEGSQYNRMYKILMSNIRPHSNPVSNRMYQGFHGNPPGRARKVSIPTPEGPCVAIGKAVRIEYEPYGNSQHKGTRFFHDFGDTGEKMIKERPILVSDRNGNIFFIPESKKYPHFSDRGILG